MRNSEDEIETVRMRMKRNGQHWGKETRNGKKEKKEIQIQIQVMTDDLEPLEDGKRGNQRDEKRRKKKSLGRDWRCWNCERQWP